MIRVIKTVFLALLFIFGITFSLNNREEVVLSYNFGFETPPMGFGFETSPIPLFLLFLFAVLLGVLLAGTGFIVDQWSHRKALREKEREIESLERELKHYRSENGWQEE
ncbi:MAG: LapA family protein [Deltaproteobacteria bacterium]|nr:LapA family protein [Deltaproteobacteria bacterium]